MSATPQPRLLRAGDQVYVEFTDSDRAGAVQYDQAPEDRVVTVSINGRDFNVAPDRVRLAR